MACSMLELYQDELLDLLGEAGGARLVIKRDAGSLRLHWMTFGSQADKGVFLIALCVCNSKTWQSPPRHLSCFCLVWCSMKVICCTSHVDQLRWRAREVLQHNSMNKFITSAIISTNTGAPFVAPESLPLEIRFDHEIGLFVAGRCKSNPNSKFKIQNSKFKIQNSKFKIQTHKSKIQINSTLSGGAVRVEGAEVWPAGDAVELREIFAMGLKRRSVASTKMNIEAGASSNYSKHPAS